MREIEDAERVSAGAATARPTAEAFVPRSVVLVEGASDKVALETLAARRGRELGAEGVSVIALGGAQAIGRFLGDLAHRPRVRLAGLCDAAEEAGWRRALERAGFGSRLTREEMERLGFYVCVVDLEDELIRALGTATVEAILDAHGDLRSFRTLQKQPRWRGRRADEQLRRFLGSGGSRKTRYARLLAEALELDHVPRPLDGVLAHVAR